jgi:uncharacterized membrane protein
MTMIEPIILVGIVIACTVWYMQHRWRRRAESLAMQHTSGLELLAKRYARGDIDRAEYLQMKDDILGSRVAAVESGSRARAA